MKKKSIFIAISILFSIGLCACSASSNEIEDLGATVDDMEIEENTDEYIEFDVKYNILSDGTAEVIGYSGEGNHATIDSEYNGHKVVRIADYAFADCATLKSVIIWAEIEEIGDYAFKGCQSLLDIDIPVETTYIGKSAFEGCTSLEFVFVWGNPDIESYAFAGCTSLTDFDIPAETKYVGDHAFDGCLSLTTVFVWGDKTEFGKNVFMNCPLLEDKPVEDSEEILEEEQTEEIIDKIIDTNEMTETNKEIVEDGELAADFENIESDTEEEIENKTIVSEYEKSYIRKCSSYDIYYMFDEDNKTVINFVTNDTYVMEGIYSGDFSVSVDINWINDGWHETFFTTTDGQDATLIDGNGYDWEFEECDIAIAQEALDRIE